MRPDVPRPLPVAPRRVDGSGARAGLALAVLAGHLAVLWAVWTSAARPAGHEAPDDVPRPVSRLVLLSMPAPPGPSLPVPSATAAAAAAAPLQRAAPPRQAPPVIGLDTLPRDALPRAPADALPGGPREAEADGPGPVLPAESSAAPVVAPSTTEPVAVAGLHLAAAAGVSAATPPSPDAGEAPPPTYATRLPGPATLRYAMRRGGLSGQGVLHWRLLPEVAPPGAPGGTSYRIDFVGRAFGALLLGWHSQGRVDAHGLAPDRFVDRRRQRGAVAANFQRGRGVISYSGEGEDVPLLPGAQDRLSWMVQLPAIVAARPALAQPGSTVAMQVTGARGDADTWTFRVIDRQDLQLPAGAVTQALHLRREPRKPRDTRVEVWLDPARQWLPVRLRLSPAEGGDGTEFLLSGEGGPPPEGPPS